MHEGGEQDEGSGIEPSAFGTPRAFGLALLAASALLRVVFGWMIAHDPLPLGSDAVVYGELAEALRDGLQDERLLFVSPLYPYVVAACTSATILVALQLALGSLGPWLSWQLARALGLKESTARSAGCLHLLCAAPLFFEGLVFPAALSAIALQAALYWHALAARRADHLRLWLASGSAYAIAVGLAPSLLPVPLVATALQLATGARAPGGPPRTSRMSQLLLFAVPFLALALGLGLRNDALAPGVSPLGANSGITLAHGNAPGATGGYTALPGSDASKRNQHLHARAEAERALARELGWGEVDRFWRNHALGWLAAEPAQAAGLWLQKALRFVADDDPGDESSLRYARAHWPLLRGLPLGAVALLPLVGFALLLRQRLPALGVAAALAVFGVCVLFFVSTRYRLPLLTVLPLLAAPGLDGAWRRGALGRAAVACWAVFAAALSLAGPHAATAAHERLQHAQALEWWGHDARAEAAYLALQREDPNPTAASALVRFALARGALDEAARRADAALLSSPGDGALLNDRGIVALRAGEYDAASSYFSRARQATPPSDEALLNLARSELRARRNETARDAALAFTTERPGDFDGWLLLARIWLRLDEPARAASALERAEPIAGTAPLRRASQLRVRASIDAAQGRLSEAAASLRRAQELAPSLTGIADDLESLRARIEARPAPHDGATREE